MLKISKELTNVIYNSGKSEKIQNFIESVKESKVKIVSVRFPKQLSDIDSVTNFVDNKWKVPKMSLKNKIIYARPRAGEAYIVFSDEDLEHLLLDIAEKINLDIRYTYLLEDKKKSMIAIEEYREGNLLEDEVSKKFDSSKYSIARCLV